MRTTTRLVASVLGAGAIAVFAAAPALAATGLTAVPEAECMVKAELPQKERPALLPNPVPADGQVCVPTPR
jgi:hypothetical protein